jgi:ATP-dependent RNA helicase DDX5/DBP2
VCVPNHRLQVRELANEFCSKPVRVNIGSVDQLVANKDIEQRVQLHTSSLSKLEALHELVTDMDGTSRRDGCHTIVFVNRKRDADMVAADIRDQAAGRVRAVALHGDLSQSRRDWILNSIRSGRSPVLVATDVAARGLDVTSIKQVINFDMPTNMEDYVHRIGRTGRAGAKGVAHTFLNPENEEAVVKKLCKVLRDHQQQVPEELGEIEAALRHKHFEQQNFRGRRGGGGGGGGWYGKGGRRGGGGGGGGGYGGGRGHGGGGGGHFRDRDGDYGGYSGRGRYGARRYDDNGGDRNRGWGRRGGGGGGGGRRNDFADFD